MSRCWHCVGQKSLYPDTREWQTYKMPRPRMAITVIFVCLVIFTFQSIGIGSSACARQ